MISALSVWLAACASHGAQSAPAAVLPPPAPVDATSVAARDASGDLIVSGGPAASRTDDPRWLASLRAGDTLVFSVVVGEAQPVAVQYRLTRLEHRGVSVAALFVPEPAPDYPGALEPYWLAGDAQALWRLDHHPSLLEPGFVPLDASGRVLLDPRQGAALWLSGPWSDTRVDQHGPDEGWVVEELSMTLEGPVRGDRCARLARAEVGQAVVVCGDVGVVQLERGESGPAAERWTLVEIRR
jgi:hypothetical protein